MLPHPEIRRELTRQRVEEFRGAATHGPRPEVRRPLLAFAGRVGAVGGLVRRRRRRARLALRRT
jgi:hypothetical protein